MRISDWSSDVCSSDLRARYIIGRISTFPLTATGRSLILCRPRMAACGMLRMGVDIIEPNTPPFVMEKVPPVISSSEILPSRPLTASSPSAFSRSEEHTSELQSLMRHSYSVFCLKKSIHIAHHETHEP